MIFYVKFIVNKEITVFLVQEIRQSLVNWQQIKQTKWTSSQPAEQHNDSVLSLILNKQEDQLISGGLDQSIKVQKVDFIKNELTFFQSLDQHLHIVCSLSFNQSQTVLASCGYLEFIICEIGLQGLWQFRYKQVGFFGCQICFINDQQ